MQKVGVHGIGRLAFGVLGDWDLVVLRVLDQFGAAVQVPFPPRRDDLDIGIERVIDALDPHLVVALARGPVGDCVGADLGGDLDLALGDQRPGDGGTEKVGAFVDGVGPEHRKYVVADELFTQVVCKDLLDPQRLGLGPGLAQLLALAQVGGKGHHLAAVGILQPAQDDGGIEAARIGEHDFFNGFAHGSKILGF